MTAWSRLKRVVEEVSGRSGAVFAQLLDAQVDAALAGARLILDATHAEGADDGTDESTDESTAALRAAMGRVEHRGDAARAAVVERLSRAVITTIDREDLFRFSRSVDDVLDNLRDFARELDLFQPTDRRFAVPSVEAIVTAIEALHDAVRELAGPPAGVTRAALEVRKRANVVRRLYQEGLAELFRRDVSAEVLRRRELLRRLDVVGLRLGEAADALADGAVKRQR